MKHKSLLTIATAALALSLSNCVQVQTSPTDFSGDFGQTGHLPIATSDCKVVCARAVGESKGLTILGFIHINTPSEMDAVKNMYENARARGASTEGESRFFVNKGVELTSKNYILFSIPTLRASGDLVQYMSNKPLESTAIIDIKKEKNVGIIDKVVNNIPFIKLND